MQANNWSAAAELFADDFVLLWPQSGELIEGAANFVAINTEYPSAGPWRFGINRLVVGTFDVVTETEVTDGKVAGFAISFFAVRDGKISRIVEYWPENFAPPAWRAKWVTRH